MVRSQVEMLRALVPHDGRTPRHPHFSQTPPSEFHPDTLIRISPRHPPQNFTQTPPSELIIMSPIHPPSEFHIVDIPSEFHPDRPPISSSPRHPHQNFTQTPRSWFLPDTPSRISPIEIPERSPRPASWSMPRPPERLKPEEKPPPKSATRQVN